MPSEFTQTPRGSHPSGRRAVHPPPPHHYSSIPSNPPTGFKGLCLTRKTSYGCIPHRLAFSAAVTPTSGHLLSAGSSHQPVLCLPAVTRLPFGNFTLRYEYCNELLCQQVKHRQAYSQTTLLLCSILIHANNLIRSTKSKENCVW